MCRMDLYKTVFKWLEVNNVGTSSIIRTYVSSDWLNIVSQSSVFVLNWRKTIMYQIVWHNDC